jgi:hypothetical protein
MGAIILAYVHDDQCRIPFVVYTHGSVLQLCISWDRAYSEQTRDLSGRAKG